MNEIINGMVEVFDTDGNPTGQFVKAGEGQATPQETTDANEVGSGSSAAVFITADTADHVI